MKINKFTKIFFLLLIVMVSFLGIASAAIINVNPKTWTENTNPVFDISAKTYYPSILKISDTDYRMWYGSNSGIGYATSIDGTTWTENTNPVTGLITGANHPLIEYINGKFRMWYENTDQLYSINSIRYAESTDGITWTNDQAITGNIISGIAGQWNGGSYGAIDLLYNLSATNIGTNPFDYSYAMYFDATTGGVEEIGLGYSSDGLNW
jgi:hypothetical protein